jgi:hypothetical protein
MDGIVFVPKKIKSKQIGDEFGMKGQNGTAQDDTRSNVLFCQMKMGTSLGWLVGWVEGVIFGVARIPKSPKPNKFRSNATIIS